MIELNLLPEDRRKKDTVKFVMPDIPIKRTLLWVFGVFCGIQVLMALIAVFFTFQMNAIRRESAALKVEYKDLLVKKDEIATMKLRFRELQQLTVAPLSWTQLLNALTDSTTKGIWFRSISIGEGDVVKAAPAGGKAKKAAAAPASVSAKHLKIDGSVVAPGQETAFIGKFIQELKNNPYLTTLFDSIDFSTMNQKKIREYDVFDFVLICAFKRTILEPAK